MVITVEDLFKDIISNYPRSAQDYDARKIYNLINQSYVEIRDRYIQRGEGDEFATSETLSSFTASQFNYFMKATLASHVLQSFPLDTVIVSTFIRTVPELIDPFSLNKRFDPEDVRNYSAGNGLKYFTGDVVFENDLAYRAEQDIIATSTDDLADQTEWEPVYWMKKGVGMVNAEVVDYDRIDRHKVTIDTGGAVVTAFKDTLFVSKNVNSIVVEYIPEHTDVTQFSDTLIIPDGSRRQLRNMVVRDMLRMHPNANTETEEDAG